MRKLLFDAIKQLMKNYIGGQAGGDWIDQLLWIVVPIGILFYILT